MARKRHFRLNTSVEKGHVLSRALMLFEKGKDLPEDFSDEEVQLFGELVDEVNQQIAWSDPTRKYDLSA